VVQPLWSSAKFGPRVFYGAATIPEFSVTEFPPLTGWQFVEENQKAHYSGHKKICCLNLQAACDSNCMFTHFSLNCPGSATDLLAYRKSRMSVDFATLPMPVWFAGDNAYPDGDHLLTPFANAFQSSPEDSFNFYLSQLRITMELAFGNMVTLFGISQSTIKHRVPFTVKIVQTCMRVHNFRIAAGCQPPRRSACINYADPSLQWVY
jgi:hypothetical protein